MGQDHCAGKEARQNDPGNGAGFRRAEPGIVRNRLEDLFLLQQGDLLPDPKALAGERRVGIDSEAARLGIAIAEEVVLHLSLFERDRTVVSAAQALDLQGAVSAALDADVPGQNLGVAIQPCDLVVGVVKEIPHLLMGWRRGLQGLVLQHVVQRGQTLFGIPIARWSSKKAWAKSGVSEIVMFSACREGRCAPKRGSSRTSCRAAATRSPSSAAKRARSMSKASTGARITAAETGRRSFSIRSRWPGEMAGRDGRARVPAVRRRRAVSIPRPGGGCGAWHRRRVCVPESICVESICVPRSIRSLFRSLQIAFR